MAASAKKKPPEQETRSRGRSPGSRSASRHSGDDALSTSEAALIGQIQREAGPAFSAAARLRIRGLNVFPIEVAPEKEKVSITLDKALVDEIRAHYGGRALSTSINELLYMALAQERLGELVDEMETEAGPTSPEAYERVLAQWFAED
jgi:uncharacterized protein (DUF4415 family)